MQNYLAFFFYWWPNSVVESCPVVGAPPLVSSGLSNPLEHLETRRNSGVTRLK